MGLSIRDSVQMASYLEMSHSVADSDNLLPRLESSAPAVRKYHAEDVHRHRRGNWQ